MGYTHYWRRPVEFDASKFERAAKDCSKLLMYLKVHDLELAGGHGEGKPEITRELVCFNGVRNCGHEHFNLGITWPAENAGGISQTPEEGKGWFAGATLIKRCCGGDCSHETFYMPQIYQPEEWEKAENGLYFNFCKTAFKPYDLAVTACLIIFKHYFKDEIIIDSDGGDAHWFDAKMSCSYLFDYGLNLKFGEVGLAIY